MFVEETEEYKIQVGRNAEENDLLVRSASPEDMWFHLLNHPSPHGILSGTINDETIQRTAHWVKHFSKVKSFASIRVEYVACKYVVPTEKKGEVTLQKKPKIVYATSHPSRP